MESGEDVKAVEKKEEEEGVPVGSAQLMKPYVDKEYTP